VTSRLHIRLHWHEKTLTRHAMREEMPIHWRSGISRQTNDKLKCFQLRRDKARGYHVAKVLLDFNCCPARSYLPAQRNETARAVVTPMVTPGRQNILSPAKRRHYFTSLKGVETGFGRRPQAAVNVAIGLKNLQRS
jgi:hypothetical protein